jgi:hypothetical protein
MPADEWRSEINPAVTFVSISRPKPNFVYEQVAVGLDLAQARRRLKAGLSNWSYGKKNPPKNFKQRLRRAFQASLGILFTNPALFQWGQWLEARLIHAQGVADFESFLDEHKMDAIVVNVPRFGYQNFLLSAAEARGIPRFLFYHTNKDVVALSRLDHGFTAIGVWNNWMKENLLAQNPDLAGQSVYVTGCSHFDCVQRPNWLTPKDEFRSYLGVGEHEKLVLYTAAGPGVLPQEERFIAVVVGTLMALSDVATRLVVRLNPMDDASLLENYLNEYYPDIIVLRPDWHYARSKNLCYQKKDDVKIWNNLLNYSAVSVNIPSTVTVECALAGLPVINLGFDLPGPKPVPGSVHAFWDVDYYVNVRTAEAAILVNNLSELNDALRNCFANKYLLIVQQKRLIELELNNIYPPEAYKNYIKVINEHTGQDRSKFGIDIPSL